jgi:hypothetical protein
LYGRVGDDDGELMMGDEYSSSDEMVHELPLEEVTKYSSFGNDEDEVGTVDIPLSDVDDGEKMVEGGSSDSLTVIEKSESAGSSPWSTLQADLEKGDEN